MDTSLVVPLPGSNFAVMEFSADAQRQTAPLPQSHAERRLSRFRYHSTEQTRLKGNLPVGNENILFAADVIKFRLLVRLPAVKTLSQNFGANYDHHLQ